MDMVFIEPTYNAMTEFSPFIDALSNAQAVNRLRSIAVDFQLVTMPMGVPEKLHEEDKARIPKVARNRQLLSRFSGLELLFVVYGRRPAAHKKTEPDVRLFDVVRRRENTDNMKTRAELEDILARNGAAPTIVFVEYKDK
jgi:hypothetical protein